MVDSAQSFVDDALNHMDMPESGWQTYQYSHEASQPGLTNHLGSLQVEADPIAVKHVVIPPISSAEETTGMLTVDGQLCAATGLPVHTRWRPHSIDRRVTLNHWLIESQTIMPPCEQAVAISVTVTNQTSLARQADLRIRLSGRCRNTGNEGYLWLVPSISTTVATLNRSEGLDVVEEFDSALDAVAFHNLSEPCCSIQGVVGTAIRWDGHRIVIDSEVEPKDSMTFTILIVYGSELEETGSRYERLAKNSRQLFDTTRDYWQEQWRSLITPLCSALNQGPNASEAVLSEELRGILLNATITALYLRRDYPNVCHENQLYLTLFPRHGEGSFYLWDAGMAADYMGRLDPQALRAQTELAAAGIDFYAEQSINALNGQGGGWYYAANLWAVFRMAWGVLCGTGDLGWLDEPLQGLRKGQTVLQMLEELSLAWTTCTPGQQPLTQRTHRVNDKRTLPISNESGGAAFANTVALPTVDAESSYPFDLADTGDRGTHLEACTTYEHQVAGANAGFVWMMRCVADLYEHRSNQARADELRQLATDYAGRVLKLFRPEDGFFSCGKPDGRIHPSRVSQDHIMVMLCMADDLTVDMREKLYESFTRELQTPAWMRCVSPQDPDVVSGFRSDTTWCGSYAGFVALMAEGLCRIGYREAAMQWLERVSVVTRQGPFAQSYWAETHRPTIFDGPAKATDELPQGTHWCEMGGVAFGSTILHGVLGKSWTPFHK